MWRRTSVVALSMLLAAPFLADALPQALDAAAFRNPPKRYRPWTVWWWFGNASSAEDLTWELAEMDRIGIGGVEINPVYPLDAEDPRITAQGVPLYSPEWRERFAAVLVEAGKRDMRVLLRGGSGWPLGGPWIPRERSARTVACGVIRLQGPSSYDGEFPPPTAAESWTVDTLEAVVAINLEKGERKVLPNPSGNSRLIWKVPPGTWDVYAVYRMFTNQPVKRAAPGGNGPVLDHFDARSLDLQLAVLQKLMPEITRYGAASFLGFAADSLELDDSNWTSDFLDQFRRRKGYDLVPYLPDLWRRLGPEANPVRQDFLDVISALQLENYFGHYTAWARRHGSRTSVQAHGCIADIIAAYGAVDLPEGETIWPGTERHVINLRNRRLASSAANLYGKELVTAESYTWLRMPRFLVTLEQMKAASDAVYLDGIRHIKNHGYSSSPRSLGRPGWVFYASTLINHNQTWWPHYAPLAAYVARMNYLMRSGTHVADALIYHNLHDARAHFDLPKDPRFHAEDDAWQNRTRDPGLDASAAVATRVLEAAQCIRSAGLDFDVVNDEALNQRLTLQAGALVGAGTRYSLLVFDNTESLPAETLRRARDLMRSGGHVVGIGRLPSMGVGLAGMAAQRDEINALAAEIWKSGTGIFVKDHEAFLSWLRASYTPDLASADGSGSISFIHRRSGSADVYFIANGDESEVSSDLAFRVDHNVPWLWNPLTGETTRAWVLGRSGGLTTISLRLGPWGSVAVVFEPERTRTPHVVTTAKPESILSTIAGPWQVSFPEPLAKTYAWDRLRDWQDTEDTRSFSGIAVYRTRFVLPREVVGRSLWLELGTVRESAEILVNGHSAGIVFMRPYRLDIGSLVRGGANDLEIRVANLWSNAILAMPPRPSIAAGPGYGLTDILYGPSERRPLPSGLLGPVVLMKQ